MPFKRLTRLAFNLVYLDVVFVRESDKELEKWAPKWYVPEKHSFDLLKRKGNELFVARDYDGQ